MWYLIVVLIFISLTTNDTKHLFISLLVVWIFSFFEVLFNSFSYLKVRLVCLFNWFIGVLCIVDVNSLSYICSNKWKSHSVMSDSLWPCGLYSPWNSPDQNTGVGSCSLLQGIFPTQESNPYVANVSPNLCGISVHFYNVFWWEEVPNLNEHQYINLLWLCLSYPI